MRSARTFVPLLVSLAAALGPSAAVAAPPPLEPLDKQNWIWQGEMNWSQYTPLPGRDYSDPSIQPSVKRWKVALVLVDYPNRSFIASEPARSTIWGTPTDVAHTIPREDVPEFYRDFLNTPSPLNHFQTMNRYWMEDSYGKYGVQLDAFGPYRMPLRDYQYFEQSYGLPEHCPTRETTPCTGNIRTDARAAWEADVGADVIASYDNIFYVGAGEDQSSTWQEFGEMKFLNRESVTDPFGPKQYDPTLPNWNDTRYVDWTSWAASANMWPNASGNNSIEAESSGMSVYAHELSHNLGILDNYNNPFSNPAQRTATGIWDMLSRGTFNGPGDTHTRYLVPPTEGGALGSQHNLRNKLKLGFVGQDEVLRLHRDGLAKSGLAVADVTAREVPAPDGGLSGVQVNLDGPGDSATPCDVATNPLCDGVRRNAQGQIVGKYDAYTLEVVQRVGSDSFTPGHGVLVSKIKNSERDSCGTFNCFVWIVDAHPEDIDKVDFVAPDGTQRKITIGDPRQLDDATFNAGLNSGSEYEYQDGPNRLHVYVIDVRKDADGILHYKLGVRSLDGAGPQQRGVSVGSAQPQQAAGERATCTFPLRNTGVAAATDPGAHPQDAAAYLSSDIYRLSVSAEGAGWSAQLRNALATAGFGDSVEVPVYVTRTPGSAPAATVRLTATSESDPSKADTATCQLTAPSVEVGGTVPGTLSLKVDTPSASFGAFTPGVAQDYRASAAATVTSTAGGAQLSVADPSRAATSHLVNGTFILPKSLQANATSAGGTGGRFGPVGSGSDPLRLLTYGGPVSNDAVTIGFKQPIRATDPLRTGTYGKTLVFTLSTANP